MKQIRTELMQNQIADFITLCKLVEHMNNRVLLYWQRNILTNDEVWRMKVSKKHLEVVCHNLIDRIDTVSFKKYLYGMQNLGLQLSTKKELEQSTKATISDPDILDFALLQCNPCQHNPESCELKLCLEKHKYPQLWDSNYINVVELDDYELACKNRCGYCVNIQKEV